GPAGRARGTGKHAIAAFAIRPGPGDSGEELGVPLRQEALVQRLWRLRRPHAAPAAQGARRGIDEFWGCVTDHRSLSRRVGRTDLLVSRPRRRTWKSVL